MGDGSSGGRLEWSRRRGAVESSAGEVEGGRSGAVRFIAGTDAAGEAAEVGRAGARVVEDDASHRVGCLVAGCIQSGVPVVVRGVSARTGESAEGVGGAVCGFCAVAEEMAGGGSAGRRVEVLETAVGGNPGRVGVAGGPAAAGDADV